MKLFPLRLLLPLTLLVPALVGAAVDNPRKIAVVDAVDAHSEALTALSDEIWRHAEIAFRETQSADALVAHAEENGFRVSRGTGEIPTAFVAEYGSGT
ncbi:MAG: hypothetical protein ABR612_04225, partial [Chromatocurvus sp.]